MEPITLAQIASFCDGTLAGADPAAQVCAVSTDTRTIPEGALFVALVGDRFDGHAFADKALKQAAAVMVSDASATEGPRIVVEDTLIGLQKLAAGYRALTNPKVVCVTGSNGKTSTKDLLEGVLSQAFSVNKTQGNLNNHIGLPLTILATEESHEVGVWEIGMNHPGEIEPLAEIAKPDIAVITNVGTAHIEHMKTRDAIALEKGMLAEAIAPDGHVILNANDDYCEQIACRCQGTVITAGLDAGDVRAENIGLEAGGSRFDLMVNGQRFPAILPIPGRHMIQNALLAATAGHLLGLTPQQIVTGLASVNLTRGRVQKRQVGEMTFIDDTYNANPDSMKAALATLASLETSGRRIAVLGVMGELGETTVEAHRSLGREAAVQGVDVLLCVGEETKETCATARGSVEIVEHCDDHESAAAHLREFAGAGDLILVKGSRGARMEKVIDVFDKK